MDLELQRNAMACTLIRFLDLIGGPDCDNPGSGEDPRAIIRSAIVQLKEAGIEYTPLAERQTEAKRIAALLKLAIDADTGTPVFIK